jgi:protein-disulfide isomerase
LAVTPYALRTETVAAANAALCAEEQRGYFAFGQTLFTQPDQLGSLTETGFLQAATAVGLDTAVFQQCLDEGRYTSTVLDNMAAARQAGVSAGGGMIVGASVGQVPLMQPLAQFLWL